VAICFCLRSELARHRKVPERGYSLDFLQAGVELEIFEQESLARTLELYHSANICVADVEARPEVYPIRKRGRISTAHGRLSSGDAVLAQLAEEAQRRQRNRAKTNEQIEQGEPSVE
jgi:hypothetical protein